MKKILITGATGFIGSNITGRLLENGYEVCATHRNTSSFEKCRLFRDKITWINTDKSGWEELVKTEHPEQFIHTAWSGIAAGERNDWDLQISNFRMSQTLFNLARECEVKKIIAFGSQAEYGSPGIPATEVTAPEPKDAYGATKTFALHYLRNLFENSPAEWYWLRVFSVFGEGDNPGWLIPTVISGLLRNQPVQLTSCEQRYNYLYIEDFLDQVVSVIAAENKESGIYNICSTKSIVLRELLIKTADLMNAPHSLLQFGSIAQRTGQNMNIEGDNSKFRKQFLVESELFGLTAGLIRTIEYYKKRE